MKEAARREGIRRASLRHVAEIQPTFRGAALELQSVVGVHFEVIIKGPAECVAGETLIYDPSTDTHTPIAVLAARNVPITVLTREGAQRVAAPFLKGRAALYRVTCENGQSFIGTAKHKVLTDQGWAFVGALVAGHTSLHILPVSSLAPVQQASPQGDRRSCHTPLDYLDHCSSYRRQYDVLLLDQSDSALTVAPLLSCGHVHSYGDYVAGDHSSLLTDTHLCQSLCPRANARYQRPCYCVGCMVHCSQQDTLSHAAYLYQVAVQSQQLLLPQMPACEVDPTGDEQYRFDVLPLGKSPYSNAPQVHYSVQWSKVSSVTFERYDAYYDMEVPYAGHYYAQGFWHHNTGKTYASLWLLDTLLRTYPNIQAVLARKVRDTIVPTVLQTYIKIITKRGGVTAFGGKKPEWYDYDNGSRLWLAGLDDPGKALSSERDIIYVNQCEELAVNDWEILTTRATGRAGNVPFSLMLGDCNPSAKGHWTASRSSVYLLRSYHKDNPTLFDELGAPTEQGKKSLSILANLSEPRRSRLFLGLDASAEGQIYAGYDPTVHLIDRFNIPGNWLRIRVIDFGYSNPFVCAWYAYDMASDRLYRYREIYQTQLLVEDAAKLIGEQEGWSYDVVHKRYTWLVPFADREYISATICDHDAEDRATLERYGIPSIAAIKWVKLGIEAVQNRLRLRDDGKPGISLLRDSLVARDKELEALHLPLCTEDEIEGYVWEAAKDGKPSKEQPVKHLDHGMDVLRYAVAFIDSIGMELEDNQEIVLYEEEYSISPI